jgi:transcription-repair coupling factor (superfamily II helicase)
VADEAKRGLVDILIGTHRLLQKDVGFKDLGLVIIDEEQRFGVAHKERIRNMRKAVDVLTMTATPIPRTLHFSLLGARDISIINTPPRDRRPIRTEICEFSDEVIQDALLKEADRGGQSFVIHNRVASIHAMAAHVQRLVPQLRIGVAHGQMRERDLERVMLEFLDRRHDVLVTTLIIESGIDIPTVNTMVLHRADTFGLAQLYQLRGRVGRSNVQAHAYLLVPERRVLTEMAEKRLRAIEEFEDLGSAFQVAMRDLEIRGAGNILGAEQHGHMVEVGFDLYMRLVDEAVRELKGEILEERPEPRMVTDVEAFLPETYVRDDTEKVSFYKRLAATKDLAQVDELEAEIHDRFGRPPLPAKNLFDLRRVRLMAADVRAEVITVRRGLVQVELARTLTRPEIQEMIGRLDFTVEFMVTGRHGFRVTRLPDDAVLTAMRVLRAATEAGRATTTP